MSNRIIYLLISVGVLIFAMNYLNRSDILKIKKSELVIRHGNSDVYPFSDKADVRTLETFSHAVLGQLFYLDNDYNLTPGLVEKFEWKESEKAYYLTLKEGLIFHNGRPVSSKDLEFSIVRGFFTPLANWFKVFFSNIKGMDKTDSDRFISGGISGVSIIDRLTLKIELIKPNPSFLHSIARSYFSIVPIEELESDYTTWKKHPVGAGLYAVNQVSSSSVSLQKVDPKLKGPDSIRFVTFDGVHTGISLIDGKSGATTPAILDRVSSVTGIWFNFKNPLGGNYNFRKAIAGAIGRQKLIQGINSFSATNELLPPPFWGRAGLKDYRNFEASSIEINKLEIQETLKVPVFGANFSNPHLGKYINVLKQQLANIGLSVDFFETKNKFLFRENHQYPFVIFSLGADIADPTVMFGLFYKNSPLWPLFPDKEKEYERLYMNAIGAKTTPEKLSTIRSLSKYFIEQQFAVPLFFERNTVYVNNKIVHSVGQQDGGLTLFLDRIEMIEEGI